MAGGSTDIRKILDFTRGVNTSAPAVTSEPVLRVLDDALIDHGNSQRRLGKSKLYTFPTVATILDFEGANDKVTLSADARLFPTGLRWTFKTLFVTDSIASDRFILGRDGATAVQWTIKHTTTSTVVVTITDSAAATTTLTWTGIAAGTVCALMVARDGATLTGKLNGTTQSGTMSATNDLTAAAAMALGADNGGSWFDGGIDHFTVLSTYETSQRDGWCRHLYPRAENVLMDLLVTSNADNYVLDRGPYELHGLAVGSPPNTRAPICLNPDPVNAIALNNDKSGRRQMLVVVGDRVYPVRI